MKKLVLLVLLVLPLLSNAVIPVYQFESEQQEERFRVLVEQLRCPKCQNQAIADSDADIAQDMRSQVAQMIRDGHSDAEIVDYFTQRYGDYVNYRPPLKPETVILWSGPVLVLLIGLVLIVFQIRRARSLAQKRDENE